MRNTKWLALCLSFLFGLGSWSYLYGVFLPFQKAHQPNGSTWENRSDIYPRWIGARELILHGRNPYSVEVTREIQIGYYGRAVDLRRAPFPSDEQRFIYPLFVVFLRSNRDLAVFRSATWIRYHVVLVDARECTSMVASARS